MRKRNSLKDEKLILVIEDLNKDLKEIYGPYLKEIILFGSYARDDNDDESDMDIMILLDLDDEEQKEYRQMLVEKVTDLSIHYNITISVIDNNYQKFNERISYVPFYKNIANEGVLLYGS